VVDELWTRIKAAGPEDVAPEDLPDPPIGVDEDEWLSRAINQSDRRRTFIAFYSWAVPTREAVKAIADFVGERKLLEVFAGGGLWARLLNASGVNVVATDGEPPPVLEHFAVETVEAEAAVLAHPECGALLVCWPPFRNEAAYRALRAFTGDRLVFVGDARFTAEPRFHALLTEWPLQDEIAIPSWPGLDDSVYLYKRH
jgi:hypothetical protein